jgi:hypothetical protein
MAGKKKDKPADPRAQSLSPEAMVALLDEAIGDDEDLDNEIDDTPEDATSEAAIAAILSSATVPNLNEEFDLETPDPAAADDDPSGDRWAPIQDLETPDLELIATDEPVSDEVRWAPIQDEELDDVVIEAGTEILVDPWGTLGAMPSDQETEGLVTVPAAPVLELPPPVAQLLGDEPDRPVARAEPPRLEALPWRGTAHIVTPELPDQLYIADVTRETSQLLVAAWELVEDEPGGRLVQVRLADDSGPIELETTAPHEPLVVLEVEIGRTSLTVRAALTVERGERGLRLGRDVLAGRFTVDPSTSNWPKPSEE